MDQTLHRLAEALGIVTPIARQRKLPPRLRQLHQLILRHFAEHATAPEPGQLREYAHQLDIELDAAVAQLVSVDLVETDPGLSPRPSRGRGDHVRRLGRLANPEGPADHRVAFIAAVAG